MKSSSQAEKISLIAWTPGQTWKNDTAVLIGGGPSLTVEQVQAARRFDRVIAINDAYQLAGWADILYACDLKWWNWHHGVVDFAGRRVTVDRQAALDYGLHWVEGCNGEGLSFQPGRIHQGQNSGFQALNLAILLGARRIILLGYDLKFAKDGRAHWFGDHPDRVRSYYTPWLKHFDQAAFEAANRGIEIINASPDSALTCFTMESIHDLV